MSFIHKSVLKGISPIAYRYVRPLKPETLIQNWNVVRGDQVQIITGKDKGKQGRVVSVQRDRNTIIVENINLAKKRVLKTPQTPNGIAMKEMPVHVSNVMLVDPSNGLPTKVKVKAYYDPESGKKEHRRYAVGSGSYIAKPKYLEYQNAWVDGEKDTEPDDVTQVTYKSALGQRPMPSDVLKEIANRRGHVF